MELSQEALETIGNYVRRNLPSWMEELGVRSGAQRDLEIRERTVRVEEEIKSQRELMHQGFEQVRAQFKQVDKRFEQLDKRLDDMSSHMNRWLTVITVMLGIIGLAVSVSSFLG